MDFEKTLAGLPLPLEISIGLYADFYQPIGGTAKMGRSPSTTNMSNWDFIFLCIIEPFFVLTPSLIAPIMLVDVALRPVSGLELGI
jgi:hypothetical protein